MRILLFALALIAGLSACEENVDPERFSNVAVSFATKGANPSPAPSMAVVARATLDDTTISGTDTLVVESAELVMREIELKRIETVDCDANGQGSDDECEKFAAGPVLISLPLEPGALVEFELDIPPGVYTELELDIHKVDDDDPADAEFVTQHPDFVDISMRLTGTFNGQSFEFESDVSVELELDFSPVLVIEEESPTNITVFIDLATWFLDAGGELIDPETANKGEPNEGVVKDNITESIEAFEDEDRDGNR